MNKQIVALSINKVQSFLFDTILSHTQEKQAETATLNHIMTASKEISEEFFLRIKADFVDTDSECLLSCSGIYIFQCMLEAECIDQKLNQLFLSYYKESQGKKQLRYVYFPKEDLGDLEVIKKAKQLLQKPENFAAIVDKNKNILFSFGKVTVRNRKPIYEGNYQTTYPKFAKDINALYDLADDSKSNHFRIAVIKADLDGMGDLFKKIDNKKDYKGISDILNDTVSLNGFHNIVSSDFPNHKDGWVFPFYVAGDDIFFAVSIANLITGVTLCRNIIDDINKKIVKIDSEYRLSLSVGVEITFNREPVRYYLNMVEKQLKHAKKIKPAEELDRFVHSKISMAGVVWQDVDMDEVKKHKKELRGSHSSKYKGKTCKEINVINQAVGSIPVWCFLLDEAAILNDVKLNRKLKENVGTSHSFYSLLAKLTEEEIGNNNIKYMNHLLYHLAPRYLDAPDRGAPIGKELWKAELLINRGIIKQLYQKGPNGNCIQVRDEMKIRLDAYLRLMILLSDERFQIDGIAVRKSWRFGQEEKESIRKELLSKPMEYLYDTLEQRHGSQLLKYFANYECSRTGSHFEHLFIEKSMFYKLRRTDKVTISKAADMIAFQNPASKEEIEEKNLARKKEGKKSRYLYFDKEGFCETAEASGQWTEDFIDSLMLLYEYNQLLRKYKKRCRDISGR